MMYDRGAGTCYLLPFFGFGRAASAAPAFRVRAFASSAPTAKFRTGPFLAVPFFGTNVLGRWWFLVVANEGMERRDGGNRITLS